MDEAKRLARNAYMREWKKTAKGKASVSRINNAYKQSRREQWMAENGPCVQCGSWEKLEIDHFLEGTKEYHSISFAWSWEKLTVELAVCQVLCHDCHVKKTTEWRKGQGMAKHGHRSTYTWHGCRCDLCTQAQADYNREWRQRKHK